MVVRANSMHFELEHGLQIEENWTAKDKGAVYHLFRYWWAWTVIRQWVEEYWHDQETITVWDLGCGCGFGCRILVEQQPKLRVLGLDCDPKAIGLALKEYAHPQVNFLQHDFDLYELNSVPAEYASPSAVVSFETVEFLKHRDLFFDRVAQLLPAEGIFLFATNHALRTECERKPKWTAQTLHYDTPTITRILSRHFEDVRSPKDEDFPKRAYKQHMDQYLKSFTVGNNLFFCRHPY